MLGFLCLDKCCCIVLEMLEIYVFIVYCLGIYDIKNELEDFGF